MLASRIVRGSKAFTRPERAREIAPLRFGECARLPLRILYQALERACRGASSTKVSGYLRRARRATTRARKPLTDKARNSTAENDTAATVLIPTSRCRSKTFKVVAECRARSLTLTNWSVHREQQRHHVPESMFMTEMRATGNREAFSAVWYASGALWRAAMPAREEKEACGGVS